VGGHGEVLDDVEQGADAEQGHGEVVLALLWLGGEGGALEVREGARRGQQIDLVAEPGDGRWTMSREAGAVDRGREGCAVVAGLAEAQQPRGQLGVRPGGAAGVAAIEEVMDGAGGGGELGEHAELQPAEGAVLPGVADHAVDLGDRGRGGAWARAWTAEGAGA
jgi:hypothetical protein